MMVHIEQNPANGLTLKNTWKLREFVTNITGV